MISINHYEIAPNQIKVNIEGNFPFLTDYQAKLTSINIDCRGWIAEYEVQSAFMLEHMETTLCGEEGFEMTDNVVENGIELQSEDYTRIIRIILKK